MHGLLRVVLHWLWMAWMSLLALSPNHGMAMTIVTIVIILVAPVVPRPRDHESAPMLWEGQGRNARLSVSGLCAPPAQRSTARQHAEMRIGSRAMLTSAADRVWMVRRRQQQPRLAEGRR